MNKDNTQLILNTINYLLPTSWIYEGNRFDIINIKINRINIILTVTKNNKLSKNITFKIKEIIDSEHHITPSQARERIQSTNYGS